MQFKVSFFKGWYLPLEILPRLYFNKSKGRSYQTDKKDFGDGWIAYKEIPGTEKKYNTLVFGFSWLVGIDFTVRYELEDV